MYICQKSGGHVQKWSWTPPPLVHTTNDEDNGDDVDDVDDDNDEDDEDVEDEDV